MYDLLAYAAMIADRSRIDAYARALEVRITSDAVVADVGTGSGIMATIACRAGARRVYALEPDDVIQVAREAAAANGFADRICFIQATSSEVDLPESVDGIVSDLRGALPFGGAIAAVMDARNRWLKPGRGWVIAERDTLWLSRVASPRLRSRCVAAWDNALGFDYSSARARAANRLTAAALEPDELAVPARCWGVVDYAGIQSANVSGAATWTVERETTVDGLGVWFDTETVRGVGFSNSPASERHLYRQVFLPWEDAITLDAGDEVRVSLRANLAGAEYVISWEAVITNGRSRRTTHSFRQSTFNGAALSIDTLRRRAETYVADLSDWARVDRRVLELMDARLAIGEIADTIVVEFPRVVHDRKLALTRVGALSERYARPARPRLT
jgi:protein arginine N-methyltransferase 1